MPRVCGLCGSSSVSHLAWCLRWIATHSLVTMPVREPEPEAEEVRRDRVQVERPVRLRAVQEDRDRGDGDVRRDQREQRATCQPLKPTRAMRQPVDQRIEHRHQNIHGASLSVTPGGQTSHSIRPALAQALAKRRICDRLLTHGQRLDQAATSLPGRGEEAVRAVPMRPQAQVSRPLTSASAPATWARCSSSAAGRRSKLRGWLVASNAAATSSSSVVEQAAGGVDEPPAGLHQARRGREDRALLDSQLGERLGRLPPLQVGIAAQRAEPGARRIDQHAVDLAGEPLDALVALVRDLHRIDVRQRRCAPAAASAPPADGRRRRRRRGGRCCASARRARASCRRRRRRSRPPSRRAWRRSAAPAAGCPRPAPRSAAARKTSSLCSAGLPSMRRPSGEYGVGAAAMPAARSRARTSSRPALAALTRRSSGAGRSMLSTQRPELLAELRAAARSASQSGRLWRSFSGRLARSTRARARATRVSASLSAARRKPALPCQPRMASRRSVSPLPDCARCWQQRQLGAAPRRWSRRASWRSRGPSARCSRKKSETTRVGRAARSGAPDAAARSRARAGRSDASPDYRGGLGPGRATQQARDAAHDQLRLAVAVARPRRRRRASAPSTSQRTARG